MTTTSDLLLDAAALSDDMMGSQAARTLDAASRRAALAARADRATRRVAPLWPLQNFVAVNPFLGLSEQRFEQAAQTLERVVGARMRLPREHYRALFATGRFGRDDLAAAVRRSGTGSDAAVDATVDALLRALDEASTAPAPSVATVADVLDAATGSRWAELATGEISKWCAAWFDRGQASWRMPWQALPLYAAWREAAAIDRTPRALGLNGFEQVVAGLPADPVEAIDAVLQRLGLPDEAVDDYLHRAIAGVGGWAAWARHSTWQEELYGGTDDAPVQLLAVRLSWDAALHALHAPVLATAWPSAVAKAVEARRAAPPDALVVDMLLQQAVEIATQRELSGRLTRNAHEAAHTDAPAAAPRDTRKAVQAVFCIDVRSEAFRRQLEAVAPQVATGGFAGFFGFPIEYVALGHTEGGAQCPVLLTPKVRVRETVRGAAADEERGIVATRLVRRRVAAAWRSFKVSAASCFSFVEAAGVLSGPKLLGDSLGLTRPVAHPQADGLDARVVARTGPRIDPDQEAVPDDAGRYVRLRSGFGATERVDMAAAILGAMSMTRDFARLVLLAGHGSTTANNPHASGLDCGACGGHTGEANARVAAAILNDPLVRQGLGARGIAIPQDTFFVPALHDTTTDDVSLFDLDGLPATHAQDVQRLRDWLGDAGRRTRGERARLLGIHGLPDAMVHADIERRSRDWSEVRPEWALAGNVAFVAAPRARTRGLDLAGRCFLHDYDWQADAGFGVLELIMTAPMVVASWINLQYYGSSVDPRAFGAGDKTLHNVVGGTIGVLEGNGGDLRVGLPWQSVHDGERLVHEPSRLTVFLEAPQAAVDAVIAKHANVRELLDNGWLHLVRIADEGRSHWRYAGGGRWEPMA